MKKLFIALLVFASCGTAQNQTDDAQVHYKVANDYLDKASKISDDGAIKVDMIQASSLMNQMPAGDERKRLSARYRTVYQQLSASHPTALADDQITIPAPEPTAVR